MTWSTRPCLRARGFTTEEIPGGCFCCRFNSLWTLPEAHRRHASPTFSSPNPWAVAPTSSPRSRIPLRRIYGDSFLDRPGQRRRRPRRARACPGHRERRETSPRKSSTSTTSSSRRRTSSSSTRSTCSSEATDLEELRSAAGQAFPKAEIIAVSARRDQPRRVVRPGSRPVNRSSRRIHGSRLRCLRRRRGLARLA